MIYLIFCMLVTFKKQNRLIYILKHNANYKCSPNILNSGYSFNFKIIIYSTLFYATKCWYLYLCMAFISCRKAKYVLKNHDKNIYESGNDKLLIASRTNFKLHMRINFVRQVYFFCLNVYVRNQNFVFFNYSSIHQKKKFEMRKKKLE